MQNGGIANKENPVVGRPDWDKVEAVISGNSPISSLGCK